jgi:hypothetical protein
MPKKKTKFLFIFVVTIAFAFQMAAAHSYYDSLIEADFLWNELKYESADTDFLAMDKQANVALGDGSSAVPYSCHPDLIESFPDYRPSRADLGAEYSILRC